MTAALADSPFSRAAQGKPTTRTPIWLNRQAGRYLPEYRKLRAERGNALDFFTTPELMAKAAVDAQRILGVDAAILFADLLPILVPMGLELDYPTGGPVIANPIRCPEDIDRLRPLNARHQLAYAAEAIQATRADLPADIPLIGFAGAPFTLASYAIEGQGSRNYLLVKKLMHEAPDAWDKLMKKLCTAVRDYALLQISAGVQAFQLFDSWAGALSISDYRRFVSPYLDALLKAISGTVPVILFGVGNHHLLPDIAKLRADVIAFDWRTPLVRSWTSLSCKAVQGNLDPALLFAEWPIIKQQAAELLGEVGGRPGHIFNLGHGILPETPVENVQRLVEFVQGYEVR